MAATPIPPAPRRRFSRRGGPREPYSGQAPGIWGLGERLAWVSGLVLLLSPLMAWYSGDATGDGLMVAVTGWNTGTLGKLVFFLGLALLVVAVLREAGIQLPATVPESLVVVAIGSLATVFVLIRLISIPEDYFFAGRSVGLWIALAAAVGVILAGLLQASEEL